MEVEEEEYDPFDSTMLYDPEIAPIPSPLTYEYLQSNITNFNGGI